MVTTAIQEQDGNVVATLAGRLDTASVPETEKALSPLTNYEGKDIILDCTDLEYISSGGLRIFLTLLKNAKEKGGEVYIRGISNDVRTVFTMTGFINIFKFK